MLIAPQVKPPPNPTKTIKSSSFILPASTSSIKENGMEAEMYYRTYELF